MFQCRYVALWRANIVKDLYQTSFIHLALMTLLACTNSEETGDSGHADGQQSIDTNTSSPDTDDHQGGGSQGPDPNEVPRILNGDVWCYEHNTGEVRYIWTMAAQATDPQGEQSIQPLYDGLTVWQGAGLLATYTVVCSDLGICTASFEEVENNVLCASATSYRFELEIIDDDGNPSAPFEMTGRIGSDASGR